MTTSSRRAWRAAMLGVRTIATLREIPATGWADHYPSLVELANLEEVTP